MGLSFKSISCYWLHFFFVIVLDMFLNGRLMSAVTVENFKKEKMCLVGRLYGIVVKRMVGRICK